MPFWMTQKLEKFWVIQLNNERSRYHIVKISLVCPASLPATPFGGILMVAVNLAQKFSEKNHEVTIYTTDLNFKGKKIIFDKNLPWIFAFK